MMECNAELLLDSSNFLIWFISFWFREYPVLTTTDFSLTIAPILMPWKTPVLFLLKGTIWRNTRLWEAFFEQFSTRNAHFAGVLQISTRHTCIDRFNGSPNGRGRHFPGLRIILAPTALLPDWSILPIPWHLNRLNISLPYRDEGTWTIGNSLLQD